MTFWRRDRRHDTDPEAVLVEARRTLGELRGVLAAFRTHLDEFEAEVGSSTEQVRDD